MSLLNNRPTSTPYSLFQKSFHTPRSHRFLHPSRPRIQIRRVGHKDVWSEVKRVGDEVQVVSISLYVRTPLSSLHKATQLKDRDSRCDGVLDKGLRSKRSVRASPEWPGETPSSWVTGSTGGVTRLRHPGRNSDVRKLLGSRRETRGSGGPPPTKDVNVGDTTEPRGKTESLKIMDQLLINIIWDTLITTLKIKSLSETDYVFRSY